MSCQSDGCAPIVRAFEAGKRFADSFPNAKRTYDAVTILFSKNFSDLWLAQVSYTWSQLRGNYDGLFNPGSLGSQTGSPQLDPNNNELWGLSVSPDGKSIAACGQDRIGRIWDVPK